MSMNTFDRSDCGGVLVQVQCSLWAGKSRLTRDDLDAATTAGLPPQDVASLGSINLIDPDLRKPIEAVKSAMFRYMNIRGVKLCGGWLVDAAQLDSIDMELRNLRSLYQTAVDGLCNNMTIMAQEWQNAHPSWAWLIAERLPSVADIRHKFRFSWRAFTIRPSDSLAGDGLREELNDLPDTAMQEVCDMLDLLRETSFKPERQSWTRKAFRGFSAIYDKLRNISFVDPEATHIAAALQDMVDSYDNRTDDPQAMRAFGGLLAGLSSPDALRRLATGEAATTPMFTTEPAPVQMPEPEPVQMPEPAPVQMSEPAPVQMPDTAAPALAPVQMPYSPPAPAQMPVQPTFLDAPKRFRLW